MSDQEKQLNYFLKQLINIEITNHCNGACKYCANPLLKYPKGNMSFDHFKSFMQQFIQKNKEMHFDICGYGEPFCNSDIYKMIQYISEMNIICSLVTNGSIKVKEDQIEPFFSLVRIGYTLDAVTNDVHKLSRPNIDPNVIIRNISHFLNLRNKYGSKTPLIKVRMNVFRFNKHQTHDLIKLCSDMGVDRVLLARGSGPPNVTTQINEEDYKIYDESFLEISAGNNSKKRAFKSNGEIGIYDEFISDHNIHLFFETLKCPIPTLRWDGVLCPCCYDENATIPIGNMLESEISEILSETNLKRVASIINNNFYRRLIIECNLIACDKCSIFHHALRNMNNFKMQNKYIILTILKRVYKILTPWMKIW